MSLLRAFTLSVVCASAACGLLAAERPKPRHAPLGDPVVLRFATVGDSRQDPVNFDPTTGPLNQQDQIWLQNSKALSRILREVAQHSSKQWRTGRVDP